MKLFDSFLKRPYIVLNERIEEVLDIMEMKFDFICKGILEGHLFEVMLGRGEFGTDSLFKALRGGPGDFTDLDMVSNVVVELRSVEKIAADELSNVMIKLLLGKHYVNCLMYLLNDIEKGTYHTDLSIVPNSEAVVERLNMDFITSTEVYELWKRNIDLINNGLSGKKLNSF